MKEQSSQSTQLERRERRTHLEEERESAPTVVEMSNERMREFKADIRSPKHKEMIQGSKIEV